MEGVPAELKRTECFFKTAAKLEETKPVVGYACEWFLFRFFSFSCGGWVVCVCVCVR